MKKILFLTYVYPYGYHNASAACSTRIMEELARNPNFEVHCISYIQREDGVQPYPLIPNVNLHLIPLKARKAKSRFREHVRMALRMPIYPFNSIHRIFQHYKACNDICKKEKFDLVIAQYFPEESAISGVLLKKSGIIDKLAVIFWDNMYGKEAAKFIPKSFALRRKKIIENWIAKYSDSIISLYPLKPFHMQNGDLPAANGKRYYLGIPSVLPPIMPVTTKFLNEIKQDKINLLYSGSIINPEFVLKFIDILNKSGNPENFNLIFFSKGLSQEYFENLKSNFKGSIQYPGYIPLNELLTVYNHVDAFISFPGEVNSIRSKVFEYMSYGHPILIMYDNPLDVNVATFSKYPLSCCVNVNRNNETIAKEIDIFLKSMIGKTVPFNQVRDLFASDTPTAYVNLIKRLCNAD